MDFIHVRGEWMCSAFRAGHKPVFPGLVGCTEYRAKNTEVLMKKSKNGMVVMVPAIHNEGNMDQHVIHQESKIQYSNYV